MKPPKKPSIPMNLLAMGSIENIYNPGVRHMSAKIIASFLDNVPAAQGRFFVRVTCASKFLSAISLIMHPTVLSDVAPSRYRTD